MSGRTGHLLANLATKGCTFLELPSDLYATWRRHEVATCHAVLKIGLGLATLCWILDTRTLCYTYAGRQARGKRRKEGAGEKALQAPRNENVQSNRGKYGTGRKCCKLGTTDASQRRGGKTKVNQAGLEIRNEKGPGDLPSA